jgi:hypothetical protein
VTRGAKSKKKKISDLKLNPFPTEWAVRSNPGFNESMIKRPRYCHKKTGL